MQIGPSTVGGLVLERAAAARVAIAPVKGP